MTRFTIVAGAAALAVSPLFAGQVVTFSDPSGLAAEAEFTLLNPTTLEIRLQNISTDAPDDFDSSDQLLTSISWDFGQIGADPADPQIVSGSVRIGDFSASANFDSGAYAAMADVSGEWGYGGGQSGLLTDAISALTAGMTQFPGANLDGPDGLDGPQGGLVANPAVVSLGGLGAIQDGIVATLTLDKPVADLSEVLSNEVRVEFGSDAAFITVPEPSAVALLAGGALTGALRRGRR